MIFSVHPNGRMGVGAETVRCAVGRGGVCIASFKREGDGKTPAGVWPLRRLLWRADRISLPETALPSKPIHVSDGWCDAPADRQYNQPVEMPYHRSAESLWRQDDVYDLVVVVGYNDDPVVPGAGSAIFLHLSRPDYVATEGCVALAREHMSTFLRLAKPGDFLGIMAG